MLIRDDIVEMSKAKEKLTDDFEIKNLWSLKYFLDMKVAKSNKWIIRAQQKYILDLSKEIGMNNFRPVNTFMNCDDFTMHFVSEFPTE